MNAIVTQETTFQERLAEILRQRRMSMRALSLKAGLEESAVKQILYGKSKNPRLDTLKKIARVLGCSLDYLACGVENPGSLGEGESHFVGYTPRAGEVCSFTGRIPPVGVIPANQGILTEAMQLAKQAIAEQNMAVAPADTTALAQEMHDICIRAGIQVVTIDMARWLIAVRKKNRGN